MEKIIDLGQRELIISIKSYAPGAYVVRVQQHGAKISRHFIKI
jgi:hypothetical protein